MPDDDQQPQLPMCPDEFVVWLAGFVRACSYLPTLTQWRCVLAMLHAVCPAVAPPVEPLPLPDPLSDPSKAP